MNQFYLSSLLAVFVLALIAWLGSLGLPWLFGIVLPYLAVLIFIVGVIRRIMGWSRSAVPFAIPTTAGQQKTMPWIQQAKIDNPSSTIGVVARMALEILTFRSLFRNTRMKMNGEEGRISYHLEVFLWLFALAFHYAFLTTLVRHLRFFLEPVPWCIRMLETLDGFMKIEILYNPIQVGLPGVYLSGIVLLAAVIFLFLRRLFVANVRYISLASDYFPLFLIMGIAFTGILMRYFIKADVAAIKELTMGLVTFSPSVPAGISPLFYIHLFFVCVLLAYFPYSKLMHMGGIFLSPTRNMRTNTREVRHVNPWNYPVKVHTYEAYEDEFREKMVEAGLPVEKMPAPAEAAATEEEEKE